MQGPSTIRRTDDASPLARPAAGRHRPLRGLLGALPTVASALLASAIAAGPGARADAVGQRPMGIGSSPCSAYLAAHESLESAPYDQWVFGFFSAMNYGTTLRDDRPLISATTAEALSFVRDYCAAHPTSQVHAAAEAFILSRWKPAFAHLPKLPAAAKVPAPEQPLATTFYILVAWQPGVSDADVKTLLDAYKMTFIEGPSADGLVKLLLPQPLPPDQLQLFLDSVRSQTKIVESARADVTPLPRSNCLGHLGR